MITTDPAYASALGISPKMKASQLPAILLLSGGFDPAVLNFSGNYGWFNKTVL